jgi:hypothetical protein
MSYFKITKQDSIQKIIDVFSTFPLNTSKRLNFLTFKEGYTLYINAKEKNSALKSAIIDLKNKINTNRPYENHDLENIIVTKY